MKRTPLKPISEKRLARLKEEIPIREALCRRAGGKFLTTVWSYGQAISGICMGGYCEICGGRPCSPTYELHPHEVVTRARGGKVSLQNSLMLCDTCHDHHKYANGIKLSVEEGLALIAKLNKEYGIGEA